MLTSHLPLIIYAAVFVIGLVMLIAGVRLLLNASSSVKKKKRPLP